MLRTLLALALLGCAHALIAAPLAARPLAARAAEPMTMKHKDYFKRLKRSEDGRLRLCVSRSNNHIYAQVIDDTKGHVVASASTTEPESKDAGWGGNCGAATVVGKRVGARALEKGIKTVHFDRNGKKYHGRIAALADGAREAGLSF